MGLVARILLRRQIVGENGWSVVRAMLGQTLFVECGCGGMEEIAVGNSVWETAWGREGKLFVGNAVGKGA